jgi:predicted molibdopterin-dependent oxidoreductase YjgC
VTGDPEEISVLIDGEPVTAHRGQNAAAILLGAGVPGWRRTRSGGLRGVFCGIGVCHDCLIAVNGVTGLRACLETVRDGDSIVTGRLLS